jgi:hypothetical protein
VDDLYNAQQIVDQFFPGAGYQAGVTYFEYDAYNALKAAGYYAPKKGDIAYEYNDWLLSNPVSTDLSVQAFLDQRDRAATTPGATTAKVENVTPEQILAQRNTSVDVVDTSVPRTDTGAMDTASLQPVAVNAQGEGLSLMSQPTWEAATDIVLHTNDRFHLVRQDAAGQWAYVVTASGEAGWIPTMALNTA